MNRFILFVLSVFLSFSIAIAQDGINYQGAATDANGDELTTQNIDRYFNNTTQCNGTNNGSGPYSNSWMMLSNQQGGFPNGNCCCMTTSGYLRSIRITTF